MKHRGCQECRQLFGRYLDAVKVWTQVNKELVESTVTSDVLPASLLDKCGFEMELCKEAGQKLRKHMRETHT